MLYVNSFYTVSYHISDIHIRFPDFLQQLPTVLGKPLKQNCLRVIYALSTVDILHDCTT